MVLTWSYAFILRRNLRIRRLSNSESDCSSIFGINNRFSGNSNVSDNMHQAPMTQQQPPAPQTPKVDLVNIVFTWNFGGQNTQLVGSFSKWQERLDMQKKGNEFTLVKALERGVHQYKFVVDNEWRFAPD